MKRLLFLYKSSLYDYNDGSGSTVNMAWRIEASSLACQLDAFGNHTGYIWGATLEEYNMVTGVATGTVKSNTSSDPNYVAPYLDPVTCGLGTSPASTLTVNSNRIATATVIATNRDGISGHNYTITTATEASVPIVGGVYDLRITPNTGGSPNASVVINGGTPIVVPQGVTVSMSGATGPIVVDVSAHV